MCILSRVEVTVSSVDCQRDVSIWGCAIPGVSRVHQRQWGGQMPFASQTQFRVTPLTSRNYWEWHRPMNVCGRSSGGAPEIHQRDQLRKSKAHPYREGCDMMICRHSSKRRSYWLGEFNPRWPAFSLAKNSPSQLTAASCVQSSSRRWEVRCRGTCPTGHRP